MGKKANEPVRPRVRAGVTTVEVDRDLKQRFKIAAAHRDVAMRVLIEEALRAYLPRVEKRGAA